MINFILITIFINLFIHYITKTPYRSLNCGLWGYFGKSNKQFNWKDFNFIGLLNDYRGGDAAGRSIGKKYQHFNTNNIKTYTGIATKLINPPYHDNKIILGHTRKTSANATTTYGIQYTQPYPLRHNNDIVGIGMHNGTTYNNYDLKKRYNVPDKLEYIDNDGILTSNDVNDSQVLFYTLIVNKDYSILENYEGPAALAWYDFSDEKLYLYSGESKLSNMSDFASIERPLYYAQYKNHLWFSSDKTPLTIMKGNNYENLFKVPGNKICIFKDGIKIDEIDIIRKCNQYKQYNQTYYNSNYDLFGTKPYCNNNNLFNKTQNGYYKLPEHKNDIDKFQNNGIESESINSFNFSISSILYAKGRYWKSKNKLAHGIIHLHENGSIALSKTDNTKPYYFIDGVMIYNHESFNKLIRKYNKTKKSTRDLFVSKEVIIWSEYPVHKIGSNIMYEYCIQLDNIKPFTGTFQPLFSFKRYEFSEGKLIDTITSNFKFADNSKKLSNKSYDSEKYSENTDIEDDLIKKEVDSILLSLLDKVSECNDELTMFYGSESGNEAIDLLDNIEDTILSVKNDELAY